MHPYIDVHTHNKTRQSSSTAYAKSYTEKWTTVPLIWQENGRGNLQADKNPTERTTEVSVYSGIAWRFDGRDWFPGREIDRQIPLHASLHELGFPLAAQSPQNGSPWARKEPAHIQWAFNVGRI